MKMADTDYVPVGAIASLGCSLSENDPSYMPCDGRELDSTAYSELFAAIGTTYGGDPAGQTFKIPDLRGCFVRGLDPEAARRTASRVSAGDPRTPQKYATARPKKPFTCTIDLSSGTSQQHGETVGGVMKAGGSKTITTCTGGGDPDTRPVNVYVEFYIKAQS
jgi:hypothetical protein